MSFVVVLAALFLSVAIVLTAIGGFVWFALRDSAVWYDAHVPLLIAALVFAILALAFVAAGYLVHPILTEILL